MSEPRMSLYRETVTDEVCRNCYNNETGRSMCPICRGVGFRVIREEVTPNIEAAAAVFKERKAGPESTDEWAEWVAELVVAAALTPPGDPDRPPPHLGGSWTIPPSTPEPPPSK